MADTNAKNETKAVDLAAIRARRAAIALGEWGLDRTPDNGPGFFFKVQANEGGRISVLCELRRDNALFVANAPRDVDALLELVEKQRRALLAAETHLAWGLDCFRASGAGVAPLHLVVAAKAVDEALAAADLPDQVSRDLKRAEIAGG